MRTGCGGGDPKVAEWTSGPHASSLHAATAGASPSTTLHRNVSQNDEIRDLFS
jgi:hypothetical protein